jgi:hypothetical protein
MADIAKATSASLLLGLILASGCALSTPVPAVRVAAMADASPRVLPFKGRLASGNPAELPPAVAASLDPGAPITFQYREELSHDEYHIPLWVSAFDPVTYFGSPMGDFGVTAFASLAIMNANGAVVADYTRRAYVSKSYNLYAEPTHRELEQAARDAVRTKIDQSLYSDSGRLARILSADPPRSTAASQ